MLRRNGPVVKSVESVLIVDFVEHQCYRKPWLCHFFCAQHGVVDQRRKTTNEIFYMQK